MDLVMPQCMYSIKCLIISEDKEEIRLISKRWIVRYFFGLAPRDKKNEEEECSEITEHG